MKLGGLERHKARAEARLEPLEAGIGRRSAAEIEPFHTRRPQQPGRLTDEKGRRAALHALGARARRVVIGAVRGP